VKICFKFQSLCKISNIPAADPLVLLGQFQHCLWWAAPLSITSVILFFRPQNVYWEENNMSRIESSRW